MDIVYSSLIRRAGAAPEVIAQEAELASVLGALWAHSQPGDGLEHASGQVEGDRIDLLVYLREGVAASRTDSTAPLRVAALLRRCHQNSPLLNARYLPPDPPVPPADDAGQPTA
ncbi:hypothetical protein [Kitasatospora viridis]|uniref:Uncharacterized protein n=1 Tax=Kitasatospora viridis TaxID=281105 RepID=A0A561UC48_9ACTN|nr:hypothetical protein [Kitasatospora viridis]TWF96933.1 hypothetical protein FHX73_11707 [Kitasatospora viridis]